jgi:hypothetical protein
MALASTTGSGRVDIYSSHRGYRSIECAEPQVDVWYLYHIRQAIIIVHEGGRDGWKLRRSVYYVYGDNRDESNVTRGSKNQSLQSAARGERGEGREGRPTRSGGEFIISHHTSSLVALALPHRRPSRDSPLLSSRSSDLGGARKAIAMYRWTWT